MWQRRLVTKRVDVQVSEDRAMAEVSDMRGGSDKSTTCLNWDVCGWKEMRHKVDKVGSGKGSPIFLNLLAVVSWIYPASEDILAAPILDSS